MPLTVYFFDLLHADGTDDLDQPLSERQAALARVVREEHLVPRATVPPGAGKIPAFECPPSLDRKPVSRIAHSIERLFDLPLCLRHGAEGYRRLLGDHNAQVLNRGIGLEQAMEFSALRRAAPWFPRARRMRRADPSQRRGAPARIEDLR